MTRSVLRFIKWRLRMLGAEQASPPVYSAVCGTCHDASVGYSTPEHAQDWALKHAARFNAKRQHREFRFMVETWGIAEPITPAP